MITFERFKYFKNERYFMAILRIAQFTDIHDTVKDKFWKTKAIRKFLRSKHADVACLGGDFVEADVYRKELNSGGIKQKISKAISEILSEEETTLLIASEEISPYLADNSIEDIKRYFRESEQDEKSRMMHTLAEIYSQNQERIEKSKSKFERAKRMLSEISSTAERRAVEKAAIDIKSIDDILEDVDVPMLGVLGNHDPGLTYQILKKVKWLDKEKPVTIRGVKFAGARNLTQYDKAIESAIYYAGIEFEKAVNPDKLDKILREREKEQVFANISPDYNRLSEEKFDVFLTHKGFDGYAANKQSQFPFSIPLRELLLKNKALLLCGHIEDYGLIGSREFQGLRTTRDLFYVVGYDSDKKRAVYVDIYKWIRKAELN